MPPTQVQKELMLASTMFVSIKNGRGEWLQLLDAIVAANIAPEDGLDVRRALHRLTDQGAVRCDHGAATERYYIVTEKPECVNGECDVCGSGFGSTHETCDVCGFEICDDCADDDEDEMYPDAGVVCSRCATRASYSKKKRRSR